MGTLKLSSKKDESSQAPASPTPERIPFHFRGEREGKRQRRAKHVSKHAHEDAQLAQLTRTLNKRKTFVFHEKHLFQKWREHAFGNDHHVPRLEGLDVQDVARVNKPDLHDSFHDEDELRCSEVVMQRDRASDSQFGSGDGEVHGVKRKFAEESRVAFQEGSSLGVNLDQMNRQRKKRRREEPGLEAIWSRGTRGMMVEF
ncbi:hypothetical protein SELMODRAFT_428792 [Selaginella moellendorffii]|uniref:Uncharacterized protein n=1 Tax=Selaginella moellendorffii TaxID=88036 RepID=D8T408_SELML|nr:hypothetical protein SELMODRAFT_428792 [Selaginella moellendorffii]